MATTSSGPAHTTEKVRSPAHEEELDRKIQEIQRNNRLIEERQKVKQGEARESGVPKPISEASPKVDGGRLVSSDGAVHHDKPKNGARKRTGRNNFNRVPQPAVEAPQWSREWDAGKLPAEQWKMNVPEVEEPKRSGHRPRGPRKSVGGEGENLAPRYPPHRTFRPSRGARNAAADGTQANGVTQNNNNSAPPRNPGFFHDERAPADAENLQNGVKSNTENSSAAQNGKRPAGGRVRQARKNTAKSNAPGAADADAVGEDKNGAPTAELGARKTSRRGGARKKQMGGQDADGNSAAQAGSKEGGGAPTGEGQRGGRRNRPRFGGGARRTSATQNANEEGNENVAPIAAKHSRARRNRSTTRDDVRRVLRYIVKQVSIEAGDFAPMYDRIAPPNGDASERKAPRRERGGARKNRPRNGNEAKNENKENSQDDVIEKKLDTTNDNGETQDADLNKKSEVDKAAIGDKSDSTLQNDDKVNGNAISNEKLNDINKVAADANSTVADIVQSDINSEPKENSTENNCAQKPANSDDAAINLSAESEV